MRGGQSGSSVPRGYFCPLKGFFPVDPSAALGCELAQTPPGWQDEGGGSTSAHARHPRTLPGSHRGPGLLPAGRLGTRRPRRASPPDPPRPAWPACRLTSAKPSTAQTPSAPPWLSRPNRENGEAARAPPPPPRPARDTRPAHRPALLEGGGPRPPAPSALVQPGLTPRADSAVATGCSGHTLRILCPAKPGSPGPPDAAVPARRADAGRRTAGSLPPSRAGPAQRAVSSSLPGPTGRPPKARATAASLSEREDAPTTASPRQAGRGLAATSPKKP